MIKKRRAFTAELNREAVRLVRERGLPVTRVAQQINVPGERAAQVGLGNG